MAVKKFVALRKSSGERGTPDRYVYIYVVKGQEVSIEVSATVLTRWNVVAPDIEKAIEILIDTRVKEGWSPAESHDLQLDALSAAPIAEKLGWKPLRR